MKHSKYLFAIAIPCLLIFFFTIAMAQDQTMTQNKETKAEAKNVEKVDKPDSEKSTESQPKIQFDRDDLTYDVGDIEQMNKGTVTIKFKNTGKADLVISKVKAG